jgi:hypothetical protein
MTLARRAALSTEIRGSLAEFDRSTHEHADADSRESATLHAHARTALDAALGTYLQETGAAPGPLLRIAAEHKKSANALVQARRVRRALLTQYSKVLISMRCARRSLLRDPSTPAS